MPAVTFAPGVYPFGPQMDLARSILEQVAKILVGDVEIRGGDGSRVLWAVQARDTAVAFQQLKLKVNGSSLGSIRGTVPSTSRSLVRPGYPVLGWLGVTSGFTPGGQPYANDRFSPPQGVITVSESNVVLPPGTILVSLSQGKNGNLLEWTLKNITKNGAFTWADFN